MTDGTNNSADDDDEVDNSLEDDDVDEESVQVELIVDDSQVGCDIGMTYCHTEKKDC